MCAPRNANTIISACSKRESANEGEKELLWGNISEDIKLRQISMALDDSADNRAFSFKERIQKNPARNEER